MASQTNRPPSANITRTMPWRVILRWSIRETMGVVMVALFLFLSAGRWNWGMGWVLVAITALWVIATGLVVIPRCPELLAERLGPKRGGKRWDTAIMGIVGLGTIARCIVAGLDVRHGWTTGMLWAFQALALVIAALSYALVVWATGSNAYFSLTVRIQKERGHAVATGGPYRFVRHPSYVGGILFELAAPILLGSWWALIPGMLNAILFVVRTALEDKTLQAELDGYQDYAARVRYRLLPGVW
jgi:protein-S-isoprenylcysteine O-methyltransferase Ste14